MTAGSNTYPGNNPTTGHYNGEWRPGRASVLTQVQAALERLQVLTEEARRRQREAGAAYGGAPPFSPTTYAPWPQISRTMVADGFESDSSEDDNDAILARLSGPERDEYQRRRLADDLAQLGRDDIFGFADSGSGIDRGRELGTRSALHRALMRETPGALWTTGTTASRLEAAVRAVEARRPFDAARAAQAAQAQVTRGDRTLAGGNDAFSSEILAFVHETVQWPRSQTQPAAQPSSSAGDASVLWQPSQEEIDEVLDRNYERVMASRRMTAMRQAQRSV